MQLNIKDEFKNAMQNNIFWTFLNNKITKEICNMHYINELLRNQLMVW